MINDDLTKMNNNKDPKDTREGLIHNTPKKVRDLVEQYGAENIHDILEHYSPAQLMYIEDIKKISNAYMDVIGEQKRSKIGAKYFAIWGFFSLSISVTTFFGILYLKLGIANIPYLSEIFFSITVFFFLISLMTFVRWGSIITFFKSNATEFEQKELYALESIYEAYSRASKTEQKGSVRVSTEDLIEKLNIDLENTELNALLKRNLFLCDQTLEENKQWHMLIKK